LTAPRLSRTRIPHKNQVTNHCVGRAAATSQKYFWVRPKTYQRISTFLAKLYPRDVLHGLKSESVAKTRIGFRAKPAEFPGDVP
jgi:hypothetical protein